MTLKTALNVSLLVLALGVASGNTVSAVTYRHRGAHRVPRHSAESVPAGTTVQVNLTSDISTETAHRGDSWTGTTTQDIYMNKGVAVPSGSAVTGVVTTAMQGTHGARPQLGLAIRSVSANGRSYVMNADMPTLVAGTQRAKKLGVIAGSAAAGALLGHAVAKDEHGTLIGGIAGGAAGYGLTRNAMRTMQVKSGTLLTFTMRQEMAMNP